MSSQFSAILFLLAFLLEVAHDAIPHHHPDANEIVVASHHIHQGAGTIFQSEDDHQHQFPPHQHYYTNEDLTASRTGISVQFDLKKSICESVLLYIAKNASFYKPPGLHSYCIISVSLQFRPFIISPDAVRGSPYLV